MLFAYIILYFEMGWMDSNMEFFLIAFLVLQKPFLSDEHRVDYVQVDEKKTQALQNTKMEWKDVRQSKTWRAGMFGFKKKTNTNTSNKAINEVDQKHDERTLKEKKKTHWG